MFNKLFTHSGHGGIFRSGISPVYVLTRSNIRYILLVSLLLENLWEYCFEYIGKVIKYSSTEYHDQRHLISPHCGIFQIFSKIFCSYSRVNYFFIFGVFTSLENLPNIWPIRNINGGYSGSEYSPMPTVIGWNPASSSEEGGCLWIRSGAARRRER